MSEVSATAAAVGPVAWGGSVTGDMAGGQAGVSLFSPEFAADPHGVYRVMRERFGSLAPVLLAPGVPATLVLGYRTALRILNDDYHFPADPREWEKRIPVDCPVRAVLQHRTNALRSSGDEHTRYRRSLTAALEPLDLFQVEKAVDRAAESLIHTFCQAGTADLRDRYAAPLTFYVMCELLGLPAPAARQAWAQMAAMLDGDTEAAPRFAAALYQVVEAKRVSPGGDVMSRLIAHPTCLNDREVVEQTVLLLGPGTEPTCNLIVNTVLLMLTDDRFAGGLLGGALSIQDAVEEVLFENTPLQNFCITYPRQPQLIDGIWLPAHQPVVISMAACNLDPAITPAENSEIDRWGNRSHLSWGVGAHACPATRVAGIIVHRAITQLLDALADLRLAVDVGELVWRPGPFHRALDTLPVVFPACPPMPLAMLAQTTLRR